MSLSRIEHVRQLDKDAIPQLISVITTLGRVLGPSGDEDFAIIGLNRAKSDRYIEIDVEQLARLLILVYVVVVDCPLVELEVVDPIDDVPDARILLA